MKPTSIEQELKNILASESYNDIQLAKKRVGQLEKISDDFLYFILSLEEKLDLMECLFECSNFTKKQLKKLSNFISDEILTQDRVYRKELIEFAFLWEMDEFWHLFMGFIEYPRDKAENGIVTFASIEYIYRTMKTEDLPKMKKTFDKVMDGKYYQDAQTLVAFYLFKLTHDKKYFNYLKECMPLNDGYNKLILEKRLKEKYNQPQYFAHHNEMMRWINTPNEEFIKELKAEGLYAYEETPATEYKTKK